MLTDTTMLALPKSFQVVPINLHRSQSSLQNNIPAHNHLPIPSNVLIHHNFRESPINDDANNPEPHGLQ